VVSDRQDHYRPLTAAAVLLVLLPAALLGPAVAALLHLLGITGRRRPRPGGSWLCTTAACRASTNQQPQECQHHGLRSKA
jgi:hypothetical protein